MMDISRSPIKLGLTVDFNNYGINPDRGEYIKWFSENTEGGGPKILHVYTIDSHVHKDKGIFTNDDRKRFEDRVGDFANFVKTKSPQADVVTFQFPYNQLPIELNVISELDQLYGSPDKNAQRRFLLDQGKILDTEKAHEMLLSYLDVLYSTDFSSLRYPPIVVLHAGGIMPGDLVNDQTNNPIFKIIRRSLLINQLMYHNTLLDYVRGKNVLIGLENIPIWDSISSEASIENQWITEHAYEDFEDRLKLGGSHIIDLAHAAMDVGYFNQDGLKATSLELIREEFFGVPKSLNSLEDYLTIAANLSKKNETYPRIIYHLCDCNGLAFDNEGVPVGSKNSMINWRRVINTMRNLTPDTYGAFEIQNGHRKENYPTHVRASLENFLAYCN